MGMKTMDLPQDKDCTKVLPIIMLRVFKEPHPTKTTLRGIKT